MTSGRPPSSRPSKADLARLETTRGAVRDALSAIRNLHELLKSVRVAPKAVGDVLPDVHAATRSLVGFTRELLDAVGRHIDAPECLHALVDYLTPPVADLEEALTGTMPRPMNAKARLDLEPVVARAADQIETAIGLVALLEESVSGRTISVDAKDLVRQSFDALTSRGPTARTTVTVASSEEPCNLDVNARAAMRLIAIGIAVVSNGAAHEPRVQIERRGDRCAIRIDRSPGPGERHEMTLPRVAPPSCPCAEAAGRAMGAEMAVDAEKAGVTLLFT